MSDNEQLMVMLEKVVKQNEETNKQLVKDNEFLKEIIIEKEKSKRTPWIVCAIVSLFAFLTIGAILLFFSQFDFMESWEVIQEQETDGGNNNFFREEATYNEALKDGEQ